MPERDSAISFPGISLSLSQNKQVYTELFNFHKILNLICKVIQIKKWINR